MAGLLKIKNEAAISLFILAFAAGSASADVRQSFKGRLETTGQASITIAPFLVEKPWRELKIRGGLAQEGYGKRRFHATLGDAKIFRGEHCMRPVDGGVESAWTFSPERSFVPEYLGVIVQLQATEFADGVLSFDGKDEPFIRYGIPTDFRREGVRSLAFAAAGGVRLAELEFDRPVSLRILYGGEGSVTIRVHGGESLCTPGNDASLTCTVRGCGTITGTGSAAGDTLISAGEDWLPLAASQEVAEGSALDFSNLRPTGKPAGKFGRIVARGEHFEFEELPGVPQRFYGVNLCGLANYPETLDDARQIAKTLARVGYNSIRIHHHDSHCVDQGDPSAVRLDEAMMAKLDNLIAACVEEGLYISTDLFVSRTSAGIDWRSVGVDRSGNMSGDDFKISVVVNEGVQSNLMAFTRNFLGHVNRHTGRSLANEPALGWISIVNEGTIEKCFGNDFAIRPGWNEAWAKYRNDKNAKIPTVRHTREGREFDIFVAEMERSFVERMRAFLRDELGAGALVTDVNDTTRTMAAMGGVRGKTLDYVDGHFYVGHPVFIEEMWNRPTCFDGGNPLKGPMCGAAELTTMRMLGKPFTVSEYNYCHPLRYRGVGAMLAGAEAALQDWAGLWRFAWSHNNRSVLHPWSGPAGYFDVASDPLMAASERMASCLFLRGDVEPLTNTYAVTLPEGKITNPDMPVGMNTIRPWTWAGWYAKVGAVLGGKTPEGAVLAGDFASVATKTPDAVRRDLFGDENFPAKAGGGALEVDALQGAFSVATPRTCGIFAESGTHTAGVLRVSMNSCPATIWASSLDNAPVAKSQRVLVGHLTDLQNSGERYADADMTVLKDFGVLPYLVRAGTAEIELSLEEGVAPTVFALDTAGNRRAEVTSTYDAANGTLRFTASVRQPFDSCLCYEIVRNHPTLPTPAPVALATDGDGGGRAESGGLAVRFDAKTCWPSEFFADCRQMLVADPELAAPVFMNDWRPYENKRPVPPIAGVSVEKVNDATVRSRLLCGEWQMDSFLQFFPEAGAIRRWVEFEWLGDGRRKFGVAVYLPLGKMPCAEREGRYILPAKFPPETRFHKDWKPGEAVEAPMGDESPVFADNGNGASIVCCIDQMQDYSDRGQCVVVEREGGISLHVRWTGEGYAEKGKPQKVGDAWLVFGNGTAEDALARFHNWHSLVGHLPPKDRPDSMKDTILYSTHPKGKSEFYFGDKGGFREAAKWLPSIKALGATSIWLRPVEGGRCYVPDEMYELQEGVGTIEDHKDYVRSAHALGLGVWRDAVMHGGLTDNRRTKEHPEWVCRKDEPGFPFQHHYWAYDFFWPSWVGYFGDWVEWTTRTFDIDGWRMDVPAGSRFPNWNPDIPYARASFSQNQGGLAQMRGVRAAARRVNRNAATLAEWNASYCSVVCDAIYDQFLCHAIFHDFCDREPGEVVRDLRLWLHRQQFSFVPNTLFMRYPESHDSYMAENVWGRSACNALMALCAWIKGFPMVYGEGEDGAFDEYRRIFAIRKALPELNGLADADYLCVEAPSGVFACRRSSGNTASVVLVNFNNHRVRGTAKGPDGEIPIDLPPYGYAVERVRGAPIAEALAAVSATSSPTASNDGAMPPTPLAVTAELRYRADNSPCTNDWRIAQRKDTDGGVRYEVSDFGGANPAEVQLVLKVSGVECWFAHAAEGSFESPFVVRHPDVGQGETARNQRFTGWIRWESARHPMGFTREHSEVGGTAGDQAVCFGSFPSGADVELIDRCGAEPGFAVVVKGENAGDFRTVVLRRDAEEALRRRDPGTGDERLQYISGGWLFEDKALKVRIRRSGTIAGLWRRDENGEWRRILDTMETRYRRTPNPEVRWHWFRRDRDEYNLAHDPYAHARFAHLPDGSLELRFTDGLLRMFEPNNGNGRTPIHVDTVYRFGPPGADSFDLSVECRSERELGKDDGDFGIRFAFGEDVEVDFTEGAGIVRTAGAALVFDFARPPLETFRKIRKNARTVEFLCHEAGVDAETNGDSGSLQCRIRIEE